MCETLLHGGFGGIHRILPFKALSKLDSRKNESEPTDVP